MATLDTVLMRRVIAQQEADQRALADLEIAGFHFPTIAAAVAFQQRHRDATRFAADLVEIGHNATRRDAAQQPRGLSA